MIFKGGGEMNENLPVMLLKGLVLLPTQEVRLELNNEISKKVIELSMESHNGELLIICPKDQMEENPEVTDLPKIGVVGRLKSKIELPNGNYRVVIAGMYRVAIKSFSNASSDNDILEATIEELVFPKFDEIEEEAILRKLRDILKQYIDVTPYISNSVLNSVQGINDLYHLTDLITAFLPFPVEKKLEYMQEINAMKRAENLIHDLYIEIEVSKLDAEIDAKLHDDLENNQKEFILKERMQKIKEELGEKEEKDDEVSELKELLASLPIPKRSKDKIENEIHKYERMPEMSPDASILHNYLDWVLHLPWDVKTEDECDLNKIRTSLNDTHYGLDEIKDRIIEYIAVKQRNPELKSPILCFVGPPGVGKTSLAMGIAKSLQKEFYKISVGGLSDAAELVGHRRTYLGANPGKIMQGLRKCNSKNPVFLIDEVDKMVHDFRGDPASALLDILDPEQNSIFTDNYIEEPFDLSDVLFILTANNRNDIPSALQDRLEMIELSSYSDFEKLDIAKKYLIPNIFKDHKITKKELKFRDDAILHIIKNYTAEPGVRSLSRKLEKIVRKIVTESICTTTPIATTLKIGDLKTYLGPILIDPTKKQEAKIGLVNGLAYTTIGGMITPVEVCFYEGKGNIKCTGNLQKVIKESIEIAISYIRSQKDTFEVSDYYFTTKDLHVHCLEGAVLKDGPSAGVTFTTALLSAILNKKIPSDIAMTGEITLHGEVLKIGGVREKITGGYNAGIRVFFIPKDNMVDLEKVPPRVLEEITVIPVSNYMDIFKELFKKDK